MLRQDRDADARHGDRSGAGMSQKWWPVVLAQILPDAGEMPAEIITQ